MRKQPRQGPDLLACAGLIIALALILLWLFAQEARAEGPTTEDLNAAEARAHEWHPDDAWTFAVVRYPSPHDPAVAGEPQDVIIYAGDQDSAADHLVAYKICTSLARTMTRDVDHAGVPLIHSWDCNLAQTGDRLTIASYGMLTDVVDLRHERYAIACQRGILSCPIELED